MYRVLIRGITIECDDIVSFKELIDHLIDVRPMAETRNAPTVKSIAKKKTPKKTPDKHGSTQDRVLAALDEVAPATSDQIIKASGLVNTQVFSALHLLKSKGIVRRDDDGKYDRVRG